MGVMAFERFVMMEGSLESNQVEQWSNNPDADVRRRLVELLNNMSRGYKNFALVDEAGMDLTKLENYVAKAIISKFNRAVKIIVIDYLGYLQGEGKDLYHKVSEIAKQIKELAKRLKCVVISLHQVSKIGKTGGSPVSGYMARDSGTINESADILIGAWRPELEEGISMEKKKEREGVFMTKIAKNRYGESGREIEFYFIKRHLKLVEKRDEGMKFDEKGVILK